MQIPMATDDQISEAIYLNFYDGFQANYYKPWQARPDHGLELFQILQKRQK